MARGDDATFEFMEPTFTTPPNGRPGTARWVQTLEKIRALEVGQWLPVKCSTRSQAASWAGRLRKEGYEVRRVENTFYVAAPVDALAHTHRWIYPPGTDGSSDASCRCGEKKNGVTPTPSEYGRKPVQGACTACGYHKLSKKHMEACGAP